MFPTRYRATCNGIAAASGKLGAIVAQIIFVKFKDVGGRNEFMDKLLQIFALFSLVGFFFTLLLPETKCRSLEENSNEEQNDFIKSKILYNGLSKDVRAYLNPKHKIHKYHYHHSHHMHSHSYSHSCNSRRSSSGPTHFPSSPTADRPPLNTISDDDDNNNNNYHYHLAIPATTITSHTPTSDNSTLPNTPINVRFADEKTIF